MKHVNNTGNIYKKIQIDLYRTLTRIFKLLVKYSFACTCTLILPGVLLILATFLTYLPTSFLFLSHSTFPTKLPTPSANSLPSSLPFSLPTYLVSYLDILAWIFVESGLQFSNKKSKIALSLHFHPLMTILKIRRR